MGGSGWGVVGGEEPKWGRFSMVGNEWMVVVGEEFNGESSQ